MAKKELTVAQRQTIVTLRAEGNSERQIEAKTGTLNGVSTLAGYATASSGKAYAFAILLNGGVGDSRAHAFQDRILKILVERG